MKLVKLGTLSDQEKTGLSLVVGVKGGRPAVVCKKQGDQQWVLYNNAGGADLKKENLEQLGKVASVEKVLAYLMDLGLKAYCPKPEPEGGQGQASAKEPNLDVERRRYYRKGVELPGQYHNSRTDRHKRVQILDISFRGLKFTTDELEDIQPGDALSMSFTLDNAKRSQIKRRVKVRYVKHDQVGTEFINPPEYDKDLGFYLLPDK
jgi:hypothetical protein